MTTGPIVAPPTGGTAAAPPAPTGATGGAPPAPAGVPAGPPGPTPAGGGGGGGAVLSTPGILRNFTAADCAIAT